MQTDLQNFIHHHGLFDKEDLILVAVSGGIDSMVLANLLIVEGLKIGVAHCNYQLRGVESIKDTEFVAEWCKLNHIPFFLKKIDTETLVKSSGSSVQMIAREERYAFFNQLMDEHNYRFTAIAQHSDDRIETILLNVLRGTGVKGYAGIRAKRDRFVRPLLFASKDEIKTFAEKNEIGYREDASNIKTDYLRNWVRLRLLPMLRQIDSSIDEKLNQFGERVESDLDNYQNWIDQQLNDLSDKLDENQISISAVNQANAPFTLLKELLQPYGFSSHQVFQLLDMLYSESGAEVSNNQLRIIRDRENLLLVEKKEFEEPILAFEQVNRDQLETFITPESMAIVDDDQVDVNNLRLRHWKEGDRFKPLGMKNWKKLSDFFIDEKISMVDKERTWLLTHNDDILWIVGHRLDDRFKITDRTQKVLKITVSS